MVGEGEGVFDTVNERWCRIADLSNDAEGGMDWLQCVHPDDLDMVRREIARSRAEGVGHSLEFRMLRPDGRIARAILEGIPFLDPQGQINGYLDFLLDVGNDDLVEHRHSGSYCCNDNVGWVKRSAMTTLLHELRTPLNSILGLSDLLREDIVDAEQRTFVDLIFEASLRLRRTVDRIAQFAEAESEQRRLKMKKTNLSQVVRAVTSQYSRYFRSRDVDMELEVADEGLAAIVDCEMLQHALGHVLDNALKFTPRGSVQVAVKGVKVEKEGFVEISVCDTGIGIPKEFHDIVFQPFRQVSEGFRREYQGLGLGLTLARRIVEEMNGSISLTSEAGKGTRIVFRFPAYEVPDSSPAEPTTG